MRAWTNACSVTRQPVGTTFAVSAGTNTIRKTRTSSEMRPASQQARTFRVRQLPEATLVLYGLFASLVWEFGHSALYVDHAQRDTFLHSLDPLPLLDW